MVASRAKCCPKFGKEPARVGFHRRRFQRQAPSLPADPDQLTQIIRSKLQPQRPECCSYSHSFCLACYGTLGSSDSELLTALGCRPLGQQTLTKKGTDMLQSVERVTFGVKNFHLSLFHNIYISVPFEHCFVSPAGQAQQENTVSLKLYEKLPNSLLGATATTAPKCSL